MIGVGGGRDLVALDGGSLIPADLVDVARRGAKVAIAAAARKRMDQTRAIVETYVSQGQVVYGVTTGVGQLCSTLVPPAQAEELQANLVRSHSASAGPPMGVEAVRAGMLVRLNGLCTGHSGVRPWVADRLADALNAGLVPWIPIYGSLGASGDLGPSAHMTMALTGEGWALRDDRKVAASEELGRLGLQALELRAKEGLALLNGTHFSCGLAAIAVEDAQLLARQADVVGSMSLEALMGTTTPLDPRFQQLRAHPGQAASAARLRRYTRSSQIVASHRLCDRVQDAYSLRCMTQVHGASLDALGYLDKVVGIELNSVTDNPLVFAEDASCLSGGNFHGQPLALALDFAALAVSELASISERRCFRMLHPALSGLPPFLTADSGLNSGYMLLQYTSAALLSESKRLCLPASADSIPTCADQEDHVSMAWGAAMKLAKVVELAYLVLAIEAICAAQALDLRRPLLPGVGSRAAHTLLRSRIPHLAGDRELSSELEVTAALLHEGQLEAAAEMAS